MQTSVECDKIYAALAAAQGEMTDPVKSKYNPHFKNNYADVQDGLEAIRPVLSKHGLAVIQSTSMEHLSMEDGVIVLTLIVTTRLVHASGQWVQGVYPVGTVGTPHQQMMANLTYSRRAGLFGLVGIAPDDQDGEGTGTTGSQSKGGSRQKQAAQTSSQRAVMPEAPQPDTTAAGDYRNPTGDVPHDPETGEVAQQVPLLSPEESASVKKTMLDKLDQLAKEPKRSTMGIWARANKPLKDRLQPQDKEDIELVVAAIKAAIAAAEKTAQGEQADQ